MSTRADVFETGIKALDLFAPIRHGDLVRWDAGFGCGHVACLTEITRNFLLAGYGEAIWTGFEDEHVNERELRQALHQLGEHELVTLMMAPGSSPPARRLEHFEAVRSRLEMLGSRSPGRHLVVAFLDEPQMAEPGLAFAALNRRDPNAVTVICATPVQYPPAPAQPLELEPPLCARVVHDPALVRRRMFPAVDGLLTTSVNLTPEVVGAAHADASAAARSLIEQYAALDPDLDLPDLFVFPASERATVTRGQRLHAFLTQPLKVSEAFSGMPGERVPLEQTIQGVRGVLTGELDGVPVREILYSGRLLGPV